MKFLAQTDGENTMKRANSPVWAPVAKPVANEEEPYKLPLMVSIKPSTVGTLDRTGLKTEDGQRRGAAAGCGGAATQNGGQIKLGCQWLRNSCAIVARI